MKQQSKAIVYILVALMVTIVWASCPAAIDEMEMIVSSDIKFQLGSTYAVTDLVTLNTWTWLHCTYATQQAMVDLGYAQTSSSTGWGFNTPQLDSTMGFHNSATTLNDDFWIVVDFAGSFYYVHRFILMKRADGCCSGRKIEYVQFEYFNGVSWIPYNNGELLSTGQLDADAASVQRVINLTPVYASKMKFISPVSGRQSWAHGRIEFEVSPCQIENDVKTQTQFDSIYQGAVSTSNEAIIKRSCRSGTYCQIEEMYYKRADPTISFQPYSKLLIAWLEGTDNKFQVDFDIYSNLADAKMSKNQYSYCNFGSGFLAFADCGPNAAVTNNAIGQDGISLLQNYALQVLKSEKWNDLGCSGAIFSVNSGLPATAYFDSTNGHLSASALFSATMSFSIQVGGLIATSNVVSVMNYDCTSYITFPNLSADYQGQVNSTFKIVDAQAASSYSGCVIDPNSYFLNDTSSAASMDPRGNLNLNTTVAIESTFYMISVDVGSQTMQSFVFTLRVFDCRPYVSFPNLQPEYIGQEGEPFQKVDMLALSNSSDCIIDPQSYASIGSKNGVNINKNGNLTVDTQTFIPSSLCQVSVNVGSQTMESQIFSIEVEKVADIKLKLVVAPDKIYEVELGEINTLNLGQFQGNDIDFVVVNFQIESASDDTLIDNFTIDYSFQSEQISLLIDLTKKDPALANSTVSGLLQITNLDQKSVEYLLEFHLICTNKDFCVKKEEKEVAFKGVEITIEKEEEKGKDSNLKEENEIQNELKKRQVIQARIKSISELGEVQIEFSRDLFDKFKNITQIVNHTNMLIEIKRQGRPMEDFTWEALSLKKSILTIKVNFSDPLAVSASMEQDKMMLNFSHPYIFHTPLNNLTINPLYYKINSTISRQMPDTPIIQQYQETTQKINDGLNGLFLIALLVNLFLSGAGSVEYMINMINALQMVLHLPMLRIIVPSNVAAFFRVVLPIVMFDVLEGFEDTIKELFQSVDLNFRQDGIDVNSRGLFDQMRSLGYSTSNSIFNLGTIFFLIIFYFIRLIVYGLVYIVNQKKKTGMMEEYLKSEKKSLFYSTILLLLLEGFMEFLITGYLNVCDISAFETGLSGEILSYILGWFGIIVTLIIIPVLFIMVLRKPKGDIHEKKFEQKYGILWEGISTKTRPQTGYFLVFCLRRILFCAIAFYFESEKPEIMPLKYAGIQIQCVFMLNIFITIYYGQFMPKQKKLLNKIELCNEMLIQSVSVQMFLFTDFVLDETRKFEAGFVMVSLIGLLLAFNLIFILYYGVKALKLIFKKYRNRFMHHFFRKTRNYDAEPAEVRNAKSNQLVPVTGQIEQERQELPQEQSSRQIEEQIHDEQVNLNTEQVEAIIESEMCRVEKRNVLRTNQIQKSALAAVLEARQQSQMQIKSQKMPFKERSTLSLSRKAGKFLPTMPHRDSTFRSHKTSSRKTSGKEELKSSSGERREVPKFSTQTPKQANFDQKGIEIFKTSFGNKGKVREHVENQISEELGKEKQNPKVKILQQQLKHTEEVKQKQDQNISCSLSSDSPDESSEQQQVEEQKFEVWNESAPRNDQSEFQRKLRNIQQQLDDIENNLDNVQGVQKLKLSEIKPFEKDSTPSEEPVQVKSNFLSNYSIGMYKTGVDEPSSSKSSESSSSSSENSLSQVD